MVEDDYTFGISFELPIDRDGDFSGRCRNARDSAHGRYYQNVTTMTQKIINFQAEEMNRR